MKPNSIVRFASVLSCVGVLHVSAANAATETVLHAFKGGSDGAAPYAGLIDVNGTLYGTTEIGGTHNAGTSGFGTVFSITPNGKEKLLYSFKNVRGDGADPYGGLINVNGTLYGTTAAGGTGNCSFGSCGTVFSVTPSGTERVLHSLSGDSEGWRPLAGLIDVNGKLYGTTVGGADTSCVPAGCGLVFSVTLGGKEKVIYSFKGDPGDGGNSTAGLINVGGTLYGTTTLLGGGTGCGGQGCGTVFSITPSGTEKVVHAFNGTDGSDPQAGLINVGGILYGTTALGGAKGGGTVFKVNPKTGVEKVLYSFCAQANCTDGHSPYAGLIDVGGILYGTTSGGGTTSTCSNSCGTVFKINPTTGAETVVYSFQGGTDGANPEAGLINVKGTLYGTTANGGGLGSVCGGNGCGTVYKITLP